MLKKYLIIFILALLAFNACVYYNTFFNAKKFYKKAREQDSGDENERLSSSAISNYNKAIKKCGKVLTEYKGSKYTDDAIFLLAKCIYYKRRNYFQVIDKINELKKYYPESEFIPEANLFLARAHYKINQPNQAFSILNNHINNEAYKSKHDEALFLLWELNYKDELYSESIQYLQRILNNYKNSDLYDKAYFSLGKTYHILEKYKQSNETFKALLNKRIEKKYKMDSHYYIGLNYLKLDLLDEALNRINLLLKKEYRETEIPKINLLKARILAKNGDHDKGISLFESIIKDNKNTAIAAEANYYLGEIYFYELKDYEKSIEYYNAVKSNHRKSEYVEDALSQSSIASQIIQYSKPNPNISSEQLVKQQFNLAEFYFDKLAQPDSALMIYDKIINFKQNIHSNLDSLETELNKIKVKKDSLLDSLEIAFNDSLSDTLQIIQDTLKLHREKVNLENSIKQQQNVLTKYNKEFIPRSYFSQLWIYKKIVNNPIKVDSVYQILNQKFPDNHYTYASKLMIEDKPVKITTPEEIQQKKEYVKAIDSFESDPQTAISSLKEITRKEDHKYYHKAKFALGYINYFVINDTIAAKDYFDYFLEEGQNEYTRFIRQFYNGKRLFLFNRLPLLEEMEHEKSAQQEEKTEATEPNPENETESESQPEPEAPLKKDKPENQDNNETQQNQPPQTEEKK